MPSQKLILEIEAYFQRETGRTACFLPSARLGLYASCVEMFAAGSGIILSPVTDDIVLFAVLAAGLEPIFVDIDCESGGLVPRAVAEAAADGAAGILTSNLYGIPDDVPALREICDARGLLLIEDCAHAMGSTVSGRAVGTFGDVSVFSFAKHLDGLGGVVTSRDARRLAAIRQRAELYVRRPSAFVSLVMSARLLAADLLARSPSARKTLRALLRPLLSRLPDPYEEPADGLEREGHRVPIRKEDFLDFGARLGLDHYHRYLDVDSGRYCEIPCWYRLRKNLIALRRFQEVAARHRAAVERIDPGLSLRWGRPRLGGSACYFKVPFFTAERERHARNLASLGVPVEHIYDPAFPDYMPPELHRNRVRDRASTSRWSGEVLPIPVRDLAKACTYFRDERALAFRGARSADDRSLHSFSKRHRLAHWLAKSRALDIAARARRHLGPSKALTILAYHRILDIEPRRYPWDEQLVSASVEAFDRQMEYVKQNFPVISFETLCRCLASGTTLDNPLIITFDDGYRDNYLNAVPVLKSYKLPATFFLAAGYIGGRDMFGFEKVAYLIKKTRSPVLRLALNGRREHEISLRDRPAAIAIVQAMYRCADMRTRGLLVEQLEDALQGEQYPCKLVETLTWDDVREMSQAGFEIGSHGLSHLNVTKTSDAELHNELVGSKELIECAIGKPVTVFAYPYGGDDAFNERAKRAVKDSGYSFAVSYLHGVSMLPHCDRFALRRLHIEAYTSMDYLKAMMMLPSVF